MAHRILYTNSTSVTGRALKGILRITGGVEPGRERVEKLIRWGSAVAVPRKPRRGVINRKAAVNGASNKLRALDALAEQQVRIPQIFRPGQVTRRSPFPLLGRKTRGQGGRDIELCMQFSDVGRIQGMDFFSEYIPTSREFRVHAFEGEVLKISEKMLTEEEKFKVPWIRNFDNGFTFRNVQNLRGHHRVRVEEAGRNAVDALGLHFGAVDVVLGDDGEVYVLEVNTGPGLSDNSLEVYARKFAEILEIPEDRLRWPEDMELAMEPADGERREDVDPDQLDRML
jgi:hypothetical protein